MELRAQARKERRAEL
jgi:hypothetical protein